MIALGTRFLVNVHFFPIQPCVKIETYNFAVVDSDNDSYKNNVKKYIIERRACIERLIQSVVAAC